jgi:uncharacterized protein
MPNCCSSGRVWRVSSAQIAATVRRVSTARGVRSPRLPIGVATTWSTPLGASALGHMDRPPAAAGSIAAFRYDHATAGPTQPRMTSSLRFLAACALAFLLTACAGAPTRDEPETARIAEALFREGDLRGAAEAWLDAAEADRRLRDRHLLRAGEAWRELGDGDAARAALAQVDARRLDAADALRLDLLRAELALQAGDTAPALALMARPAGSVPSAQRPRLFELRGRALDAQGDRFGAAAEFARLDALLAGVERRENARRVRGLLRRIDDDALRAGAPRLAADDPLRPFIARALGNRGLPLPAGYAAPEPATPVPGARADSRIALLLPLSGPLRPAALSVRDGFLAARFGSAGQAAGVILIDSGDTAEQTIAAYRRAVAEGAERVVGPLSRDAVGALFGERDLPVPVLALNRSIGAPPPGHMSFALTPEDEAAAAARLLAQRAQGRVVAVVSSEEAAQRALEAFRARHALAGGELLAVAVLPPTGVDFQSQIRDALSGAGLPTSAPTDLTIPHDPGFDALFLALRPGQARLAVPQLKLSGLVGMPMIATSMLHSAEDGNPQDRELEGVEFTELPWLVGDRPGMPSREALRGQLDTAGGGAARLFAFGMDAWRVLQEGAALEEADLPVPGATGEISLDALGDVRSQPVIAHFRAGRARLLESGGLRSE